MNTPITAHECFELAVKAHQSGNLQAAERGYREALAIDPNHSSTHNNLGLILAMTDRIDAAIENFRHALRSEPQCTNASVNLAQALQHTQRYSQALKQWQHATTLSPQQMDPPLAGALLAMHMGEITQAMDLLEKAAAGEPEHDKARSTLCDAVRQLGAARLDAGEYGDAHRMASLLGRLEPDGNIAPRMLERCLGRAQLGEFDAGIKSDLLLCYRSDAVDHRELGRVGAQVLLFQYPFLRTTGPSSPLLRTMCDHGAHRDPLLLALLQRSINTHTDLERALAQVRGELLSACFDNDALDGAWREFAVALAMQCVSNEYLYSETAQETAKLALLGERLGGDPADWGSLAVLLSYRAVRQLENRASIERAAPQAPAWIAPLLQRAILEPLAEKQFQEALSGGAFADSTSRSVQSQYEESPYPRWQNLQQQNPLTIAELLREQITNFEPPALFEQPADILIAGCGTGEHALRVAARHPECHVHAIDLSRASLAYAMRKARELGINNIDFQHRDILELHRDEKRYALIESVGVIHHMHDPAAGLRALCTRLAPDGIIKLGLYSRAARTQVNAARARIDELGLGASAEAMRSIRERIINGQEPQLRALCDSRDFYTLSTVRDLLFHVQEHQYDMHQLRALLAANDLHVIGFQVPAGTRRRYQQRFADDPALANLQHWADFEQDSPHAFAGMYQFWCRR